jgi:hypothetical protein
MASSARIPAGSHSQIETGGRGNPKGAVGAEAEKADAGAVSPEERHQMIAVAAYYLAERRGFCPGYEIQDWCAAEQEVDRQLENRPSH